MNTRVISVYKEIMAILEGNIADDKAKHFAKIVHAELQEMQKQGKEVVASLFKLTLFILSQKEMMIREKVAANEQKIKKFKELRVSLYELLENHASTETVEDIVERGISRMEGEAGCEMSQFIRARFNTLFDCILDIMDQSVGQSIGQNEEAKSMFNLIEYLIDNFTGLTKEKVDAFCSKPREEKECQPAAVKLEFDRMIDPLYVSWFATLLETEQSLLKNNFDLPMMKAEMMYLNGLDGCYVHPKYSSCPASVASSPVSKFHHTALNRESIETVKTPAPRYSH